MLPLKDLSLHHRTIHHVLYEEEVRVNHSWGLIGGKQSLAIQFPHLGISISIPQYAQVKLLFPLGMQNAYFDKYMAFIAPGRSKRLFKLNITHIIVGKGLQTGLLESRYVIDFSS